MCIKSFKRISKMYDLHVNDVYDYLFDIVPLLMWVACGGHGGLNCFRFSMRFTFTSQSELDLQVGCPRYLLRTLLKFATTNLDFLYKKKTLQMRLVWNHYITPKFTCIMIQNVNQNDATAFLTRAMISIITAVARERNAA